MKQLLLAGTAFLGLAASGLAARATPFDFTYTGSVVTFTVPTTDSYQILAARRADALGLVIRPARVVAVPRSAATSA
jgi:hypothetical protein